MRKTDLRDIEEQVLFVTTSIARFLTQIDRDPLSSTFGCAHLAYWRDKTSPVADARRQEAMLPLALLYCNHYPGSYWTGQRELLEAAQALLSFWLKSQYSDGSLDEWYKGERAFAAAAFGLHAAAKTVGLIGDELPRDLHQKALTGLRRTANWICRRDDLFKTNHQAVGVAALAYTGKVLNDDLFIAEARKKLKSIIAVQTNEGWFPEVGTMDLGYTFLTVEFAVMAMDLLKDWSLAQPFVDAFEFGINWLHPDLTSGPEYGVCHNPYVSRIASILLADRSPAAAYLVDRWDKESNGFAGLAPTLADDLRFPRWAWQPLLAHDYATKLNFRSIESQAVPLANISEFRYFSGCNLARVGWGQSGALIAAAAGGLTRLFGPGGQTDYSDFGYGLCGKDLNAASFIYGSGTVDRVGKRGLTVSSPLSSLKNINPPFWTRAVLHVACSTAWGSRWSRRMIDLIRKRKGTAMNQSSAVVAGTKHDWNLQRKIELSEKEVVISDVLTAAAPSPTQGLVSVSALGNQPAELTSLRELVSGLPENASVINLVKRFAPAPNWTLASINLVKAN